MILALTRTQTPRWTGHGHRHGQGQGQGHGRNMDPAEICSELYNKPLKLSLTPYYNGFSGAWFPTQILKRGVIPRQTCVMMGTVWYLLGLFTTSQKNLKTFFELPSPFEGILFKNYLHVKTWLPQAPVWRARPKGTTFEFEYLRWKNRKKFEHI